MREHLAHRGYGGLDPCSKGNRISSGGDVAKPLVNEGLGQDGGRCRSVTSDLVGLPGDVLDQRRAHVLEGIVELNVLRDAHAVVGDRRGTPPGAEHDIATFRTEGHAYGVGKGVHAALQGAPGLFIEGNHLGHVVILEFAG